MTLPPTGAVPVCYRHPSRETYVRCARCDRPICPDCMNEASVGHQCPECVAAGRRTQRPARTAFGGTQRGQRGTVTISLIAVNVLVMLIALATAGSGAGRALGGQGTGGLIGGDTPLHWWGGVLTAAVYPFDPAGGVHGIAAGEYYRLFTAMFLHFGPLHLIMNMWALWVLGRSLEAALGPARFLALYLVAGVGGNVAVYLFGAPNQLTAGASTAVFGLFAALFFVLRKLGLSAGSVVTVLVINLVITFTIPSISIWGHLGGLVTGAVVGLGLAYAPRNGRTQVQVGVILGTLLLLGMATIARTALLVG